MLKISISALLVIVLLVSCNKNNKVTPVCDGSTPTYNSYVKNIITSNCVGCHAEMSTYSGLSSYLSNGKFEKQVLIKQKMPKSGTLADSTLNKLQCWVNNGFPEN